MGNKELADLKAEYLESERARTRTISSIGKLVREGGLSRVDEISRLNAAYEEATERANALIAYTRENFPPEIYRDE
jgi:ribosomal 50S subunit-associated protein YjgA (DUF615 family)